MRSDLDSKEFRVTESPRITHNIRGVIEGWTELLRAELDDANENIEEFDRKINEAIDLKHLKDKNLTAIHAVLKSSQTWLRTSMRSGVVLAML